MLKKIFGSAILVIFFFSVLFTGSASLDALVKGWTPPEDEPSSLDANVENALGIVIQPSTDKENSSNEKEEQRIDGMNMDDLFGPEQIFPFEPGL